MRMFAGPNGSGKSTLKAYLPDDLLGIYLNPDEIEQGIRERGFLDCAEHGVSTNGPEAIQFFRDSDFLTTAGLAATVDRLTLADERLDFSQLEVNSYLASVAVDFLRQKLLAQKRSFTFETVMSHPGKVDLLAKAQEEGYRTYLYYVATDDPTINISRVRNRVRLGGHAVPEERIVQRYHRSLNLLWKAIQHANRAYIFDNSGDNSDRRHTWLAEITEGRTLELKSDLIPAWFKTAVLDRIDTQA